MRDRHAKLWRKARQALRELPAGPCAAIKCYWKICGCPGDPVYLLTIIHEHKARKVCYWHVMAERRRVRLRFQKLRLNDSGSPLVKSPKRELIPFA